MAGPQSVESSERHITLSRGYQGTQDGGEAGGGEQCSFFTVLSLPV